ncbi:MAG: competence/damage-inducible protein A [Bacteroidota bacterium]
MKAEILTIGDEILIGQIINTNSVWMAQQLNMIGISVIQMSSVADQKIAILDALEASSRRADIILITGGLGPTKDDITKNTFCEYFNTKLILNQDVLEDVTLFFEKFKKQVTEINKKQAEVPMGCRVIRNKNGTAPGMWMERNNKHFISMPGVPYEMKAMMTDDILPELKKQFKLPFIYHKTILTQGIGESALSELIADWEDGLAKKDIRLAYLPSPGMVRLRLSSKSFNDLELKQKIDKEVENIKPEIEKYIYGYENYGEDQPKLEEILGKLLLEKNLKLALAESCTGGYISHLITSVAGSSAYFNGCIVPYHNKFKHELLNVDNTIFEIDGAVSEKCVSEMVKHTLFKFNADVAIAVSGIAGPSGGTLEKPIGTTWIAVAYKDEVITKKFLFGDNRQRNIQVTANTALNMLRKLILKVEK